MKKLNEKKKNKIRYVTLSTLKTSQGFKCDSIVYKKKKRKKNYIITL